MSFLIRLVSLFLAVMFSMNVFAQTADQRGLSDRRRISLVGPGPKMPLRVEIGSLRNHGVRPYVFGDADGKSERFDKAVREAFPTLNLETEFQDALVELLSRRGFTVDVLETERDKSGAIDLEKLESANHEAIVHIDFVAGYYASGPTTDYHRAIDLDMEVFDPRSKTSLFKKHHLFLGVVRKGKPPENQYDNIDAIMADLPQAVTGLKTFARSMATQMAANYLQCETLLPCK